MTTINVERKETEQKPEINCSQPSDISINFRKKVLKLNTHFVKINYLLLIFLAILFSCKKNSGATSPVGPPVVNGVTVYAPSPVLKSNSKKVFVHLMPWFETKATNNGAWGIHWKMHTQNPDIIDPVTGQRQIASHFYPLIGPYASGDTTVIEYQLLLMKLSGIDGVFIDWPGTQAIYDYPLLVKNTAQIVSMTARVGLKYAIVYEDQNLVHAADKAATVQADMNYLQTNFFTAPNYEKLSANPLLLVFGPQQIQSETGWSNAFSVLNPKPAFFTLWFQSSAAGNTASGEFAWIPQDNLNTLNYWYGKSYTGLKIASAYPGFVSFYADGGWGGPTWTIPHNGLSNFSTTLDLALAQTNINYIQLATWNDYGEGTMIEPTKEFNYGFLTTLQQKLGVANLTQSDLEMVAKLYGLRVSKAGDAAIQLKLNQVFYYIVSLQNAKANSLLSTL